jgi:hypothetical protein
MGLGQALQNIGGMYLQRNWQKQDAKKAEDQRKLQQAEDQKIWEARQQYLARLQAPQERVRQVYDEQLKAAVNVRESYRPPTGDMSQGPPEAGRWVEEGRDRVAPKAGELKTFRQGDEEVTAMIDPETGEITREIGRGSAFSPSQRRTAGVGGSSASGGGSDEIGADGKPKSSGKASDWVIENGVRVNKATGEEVPLKVTQQALRETEEAKARGQNAQTLIEKAEAAKQQLAILDRLTELQKGTMTGPIDQYVQSGLMSDNAQEYDAQATRLLAPTLRAMFGANPTEGERKAALGALPSRDKQENVNANLIAQMRAQAQSAIDAAAGLNAGGPAGSSPNSQGPQGKPSQDRFLEEARKANPGVSDADLIAYYMQKYGVR